MGQQRPACKRFADGILGERITAGIEYSSSLVKATRCQRDVRRDHNVVRRDVLHNPVIDSIELPFDYHKFVPVPVGNANPRIGDDSNMEIVPLRHAVHFLLYGAGIGVNEYLKHFGPFLPSVTHGCDTQGFRSRLWMATDESCGKAGIEEREMLCEWLAMRGSFISQEKISSTELTKPTEEDSP
jgi:hypothetical protein